ncbi:hypothetical protein MNBD_ALPHA07-1218 [hydrothermal vent metagenome]|uniref:Uncharacterized protein n=1 Tax=hydrothermal vent metagenome TaxID=652676 RepID=A0A3B0S3D3_9ZZZZ
MRGTMRNSLDLIKVGGACLNALAKEGCEVEIISDFVQAEDLVRQMGKTSLTVKLSGQFNDFTEESGFWLFMKEHGEYVTAVATRFDDVGRESMGDYMIRTMRRHYPHESGRTLLDFTGALPPRFHGHMAYIGELFVRPEKRGSLRRLRYFMILLQSCIATKWKVDWVYAMMRDRDVKRGFAANYGFSMQLPGVARWASPVPEGRGDAEWLVALPADHMAHMMRHYAGSLESL